MFRLLKYFCNRPFNIECEDQNNNVIVLPVNITEVSNVESLLQSYNVMLLNIGKYVTGRFTTSDHIVFNNESICIATSDNEMNDLVTYM